MTQYSAETIKKRLTEISKEGANYQNLQRLMTRYAIERFNWRVGQSQYADQFVLKGAMAFTYYVSNSNRTTADVDFMIRGYHSIESIKSILSEIVEIQGNDGITFNHDDVSVSLAGRERQYPGYKARIPALLGTSPCHVIIDFSFGEAIVPRPKRVGMPAMVVDSKLRPMLRIYPIEVIIAEKYQTIVRLGMGNTRLKDHHDLYEVSQSTVLSGKRIKDALQATFRRRATLISAEIPIGLTEEFYGNKSKQKEWKATLAQHNMPKGTSLEVACANIITMLHPIIVSIYENTAFALHWRQNEWK